MNEESAVRAKRYSPGLIAGLFVALFFGVSAHLVGIFSDLLMARSLGIEISYLDIGWIYAIIYIASTMPFAIAGGIGIRELTLVAILSTFGVKPEVALAFSLLIFARMAFVSITGGVLEMLQTLRKKRLTADV